MSQKVLIVDDSAFIRKIISDWVQSEPDLELAGVASNGEEAIKMAAELKPDVITLDVEMPVMDGLTALAELKKISSSKVLMVSSLTAEGANETLKALDLGAYDFVTKPHGSSSLKIMSARAEILEKIRSAAHVRTLGNSTPKRETAALPKVTSDKVVVIASSTGGPKALASLFMTLPKGFPAPILIVQHMPVGFTQSFARRLDGIGTVPCKEAMSGDKIVPGMAYVAPGGFHMVVTPQGTLSLNTDPNIHGTRPAADPLFHSAVQKFGSNVIGVVLTGMGKDGAEGALAVKNAGSFVFGQSEETCTIYGMPKAAMQAGAITEELSIDLIGPALVKAILKGGRRAA